MAQMKRLWTDEEMESLLPTIALLRRMRTAAVTDSTPLGFRVNHTIYSFFHGKEQIRSPQEALAQAEELANATGEFLGAKLSKSTHGTTEYQNWQDLLSDSAHQYDFFNPTTYARTSLKEVAGDSWIGRMRNLSIDPQYVLHWELCKNNNLGANTVGKLVRNEHLGVVSPLSGDYLVARIYRTYLERTRGESFEVRTAAISRDLSTIVLPLEIDGRRVFSDKSNIGLFIDTTATGNTSRALFAYLQENYPTKTVHEPSYAPSHFVPSKKIARAMGT